MNWKLYGWSPYNVNYKKFYYSDFHYLKDLRNFFGYDFFYKENYRAEESQTGSCYEMWDCHLKPGDVVVDLGANVGFFTRRAAEIGAEVISVEGSPEIFSCLVENTHDLKNVRCINAIVVGDDSDIGNCYSNTGSLKVTLEQIMKLFNLEKIDFLKCDIEGGEWSMFSKTSTEILNKIDRISMEPHSGEGIDIHSFHLPNKIKHTFYWGGNPNFYFVPM